MRSLAPRTLLAATLVVALASFAHGQITLTFPSTTSISGGPTASGALGAGGGFLHYTLGDDLTQSFTNTGIASANSSRWVFSMSDWNALGVVSTFNAQINGITVGNFSLTGTGDQKTNNFDLTFSHAAIAGQNYTLRIVSTTTLPIGQGSWNWVAGGGVTLNGSLPAGGTLQVGGIFQVTSANLASISGKAITLGDASTGANSVGLLVNLPGPTTLNNAITVAGGATGSVVIGTNSTGTTAAITFSGPVVLNRATTMQGTNTDRTTYSGNISGSVGTLTVTGGARTTWQGDNTFVGDVLVTGAGTILQVGSGASSSFNRIPDASNVTLEAGTTLRLQNNSEVINGLNGSGTVNNITAANTFTVGAGNANGSFSGLLEDGAAMLTLFKTGTGIQTLSGLSTYSGTTSIQGGALRVQHAQALGSTAGVTSVTSGARLELAGNINVAGETLNLAGDGGGLGALYSFSGTNTWSGPIDLGTADVAFGAAAGQTLVVASLLQNGIGGNAVNIASGNQGVVQLTNTNTYVGGTTIAGGTVSIASAANLGNPSGAALLTFTGNGTLHTSGSFATSKEFVANGAARSITFDVAAGQTLTANGAIRSTGGAGVVTKTGSGTLVLGASNTQLDTDVALVQGTLDIRHAGALGDVAASDFVLASGGTTTRLSFDSSTAVTGSFQTQSSGANLVVDRVAPGAAVTHSLTNLMLGGAHTFNIAAGSNITSGTAGLSFTGTTTLSGNATINSDVKLSLASVTGAGNNFTIAGTGSTTISGAISNTTGTVTKQGTGTLTLQGTSSYSGATNVEQGTLALENGSIASSSLTTISSGATLTGTGTTGALAISAGGTHNPGTGIGTTTVMGNYNVGGALAIELASAVGTAGVTHDLVDVTGGVTLNATTSSLATSYTGTPGTFNPTFAQVFTIIRNDDTDAVTGRFAALPAGANVFIDGKQTKIYYDQGTGNDVVLVSNVGVAPQLFVNDQWTAAATVDGDQQTGAAETAFVGVNAFASTAAAFAAQTNFSGPLRLNAGTYSAIDLTASGAGTPANVTLQLVRDPSAPTTEVDITVGQLFGNAGDQIATQFHGGTGGNLIVGSGAFGGIITGGGGVTKTTTGALTLSGANNYTGTTFVNAGTLIVNNTTTGQGDYLIASGARLGGFGKIGLAAGKNVTVSAFPGELSPGATTTPYTQPTTPGGYTGHALDATYSAGIDSATVGTLTVTGDVNLGGNLLMDLVSHNSHDVLDISGTLTIGPTATLEINGVTDFTQLDFVDDLGLVMNDRVDLVRATSFVGRFSNIVANQSFTDAGGRSIFFGADARGMFLMAQAQSLALPEPHAVCIWLLAGVVAACVAQRLRLRQRIPRSGICQNSVQRRSRHSGECRYMQGH